MKGKVPSDVSIVRCGVYNSGQTLDAVRQAVDLLGGMQTFVKPGNRVLIKPNLLKASHPVDAVTTHPEVIRATIRLVREAGAEALVGDSPGFGDLRRVCEKSGVMDVIEEEGAILTKLDEAVQVKNHERFRRFDIARAVHEADVVINLPKFKTHGMMTITGAVKNLFGCIPGKRKIQWHFNAGVNRDAFARMLVELCSLIGPRLTVMDAVVGMEGNGPGSGDPRKVGLVLAGQDPVALDVVSGRIIGADPSLLYIVRAAAEAGVGETRLDSIQIHGEALDDVAVTGYRLPPQEHLEWHLPEWVRRMLKGALTTRPVINHALCVRCGICQGHCPQNAIYDAGRRLEIRYRDCIRCFCCQEFCPRGAISVGRGWALKIAK
ncbi:MAG TPA: DUF362 domain-containing protein [Nitrospirota bacterium]|nr:DUF362 domain-containing protein [Nitrospirota bacterium]